jgi:hypothetical protein
VPTLTPRQIYALAADAGFKTPGQAITMTAIALAESGGNTDATNTNTNGSVDTGLWQINSVHGFGGNLKDPRVNAQAAKAVFDKQSYTAWTVFKTGAYRSKLPEAISANPKSGMSIADILKSIPTAAGTLTGVAGDVASAANPLAGLGDLVGLAAKAGTFLMDPQNWLRILYVAIGGALVIGALVIVAQPVAEPVVKAAGKAADIAL